MTNGTQFSYPSKTNRKKLVFFVGHQNFGKAQRIVTKFVCRESTALARI